MRDQIAPKLWPGSGTIRMVWRCEFLSSRTYENVTVLKVPKTNSAVQGLRVVSMAWHVTVG